MDDSTAPDCNPSASCFPEAISFVPFFLYQTSARRGGLVLQFPDFTVRPNTVDKTARHSAK